MSNSHVVIRIDHHQAQMLRFDDSHLEAATAKEHAHYTRQHGSAVRSEHEFFGHVCDELTGAAEVLVTGSHQAQADFKHYVEKHRPAMLKAIAGWQTVDSPSDGELVALARRFFLGRDQMRGKAPLG